MTTIRRIVAVATAVLTLVAAGTASAGQFNLNGNGSYVQVPPANAQAIRGSAETAPSPTIVRLTTGGGFNWGDAGIGAAAGVALATLVLGGGLLTVSQRRTGGMRGA
jgi:hypothetical protein